METLATSIMNSPITSGKPLTLTKFKISALMRAMQECFLWQNTVAAKWRDGFHFRTCLPVFVSADSEILTYSTGPIGYSETG